MTLAKKLQLKTGQSAYVGNAPERFVLDLPEGYRQTDCADEADLVLVFVKNSSEIPDHGRPFIEAAQRDAIAYIAYPKAGQRDAIAYIAYPKAGQLGTDLNRDILWGQVAKESIRGVRQVSIDEVWSAMRFRPAL